MKFYNPFKPHIIKLPSGDLCVRRLTIDGYECLELKGPYRWSTCDTWRSNCDTWQRCCASSDREVLLAALDKYTKSKQRLKVLVNEIL